MDVFFSYAQPDEDLRDRLEVHLAPLRREGRIRTWHDRKIGAGLETEAEKDRHLAAADLVLLLISPDFIASDDCFEVEMRRALERHAAGDARVIPILLRAVDDRSGRFASLQALPADGHAVTSWSDREAAFHDIARGIRAAIDEIAPLAEPLYPDDATRELSLSLERSYRQKADLEGDGHDTSEITAEILDLRRQMRDGARLKAGDFLADGRFKLSAVIGQGGFAQVWRAYDHKSRSLVAIKVLHGQYAQDRSRRERFFRGARQMARLSHPHIVRVIEEDLEDGGFYFYVMEYVRGENLRRAVLDGGLPLAERLRVVLEVGDALQLAHERGVIHRDVKPGNILLDETGRSKLTDFDLVRAADTTGGTRTQGMLGTFLYTAPEVLRNPKDAGVVSDLFSLGMTAIFTVAGEDLSIDVLRDTESFIQDLDCRDELKTILNRAVAWKSGEREDSTAAFCQELRMVLSADAESRSIPRSAVGGDSRTGISPQQAPAEPAWAPRPCERDQKELGIDFVSVPGGIFTLGEADSVHRVHLSPFGISKTPITNAQYRRFLEAEPHREKPRYWNDKQFNDPLQPVVGVSWLEAMAYCRWAGAELPTEAQWEAAARGTDTRPYPWGAEEPSKKLANFGQHLGTTSPVGHYPDGAGLYGTLDQAGNVWEWCRDRWDKDAYKKRDGTKDPVVAGDDAGEAVLRVVRGGSWGNPPRYLLSAFRFRYEAGLRFWHLGFRVVCVSVPEHGS